VGDDAPVREVQRLTIEDISFEIRPRTLSPFLLRQSTSGCNRDYFPVEARHRELFEMEMPVSGIQPISFRAAKCEVRF
jgi:hypothetical protein